MSESSVFCSSGGWFRGKMGRIISPYVDATPDEAKRMFVIRCFDFAVHFWILCDVEGKKSVDEPVYIPLKFAEEKNRKHGFYF